MRWLLMIFGVTLAYAQTALSPDLLRLSKIKARVVEGLKRLPNYTCTEVIQRSQRDAPTFRLSQALDPARGRFRALDTVQVEVAFIGGTEVYGGGGASRIDQTDVSKVVGGTSGTGAFALVLESVFHEPVATFQFVGAAKAGGKKAVRYDFQVPQFLSHYRLKTRTGEAVVGYHGSFWADPATLDLMRLEFAADDIPLSLRLGSAQNVIEYRRMVIGNSEFLLPVETELIMADAFGAAHRNQARFQGCRQFTGQSVVSFPEPGKP